MVVIDVSMMFIDINSIVLLNIYDVDYHCIVIEICKSEAMNSLRNSDCSKNSGYWWNIKNFCLV